MQRQEGTTSARARGRGKAPVHCSAYTRNKDTMPATTTVVDRQAEAVWDAEAGEWAGQKAAGHEGEIPSPLWIFG